MKKRGPTKTQIKALEWACIEIGEILKTGPLTMSAMMTRMGMDHGRTIRILLHFEKAGWLDRIGGGPGEAFQWIVRKE